MIISFLKTVFSFRYYILTLVFVFGGALYWQKLNDDVNRRKTDPKDAIYTSPNEEFSMVITKNWLLNTDSFQDEGVYSLQLEGAQNNTIATALKDKYGIDVNGLEEEAGSAELYKAFQDPLAREYAYMSIDAISADSYELYDDVESWKKQLIEDNPVSQGVSFSNFSVFSVTGGKGLKYRTTIIDQGVSFITLNYFVIGKSAQIEISLMPINSNFRDEADAMVKSIVIN